MQLAQTWPLDVGMVLGGWCGLLLGNWAVRFVKDANSLHWPMVVFLSYAAAMMVAAGCEQRLQQRISLGIAGVASATAIVLAARRCCRGVRTEAGSELNDPIL